jgi:hypothetical protein
MGYGLGPRLAIYERWIEAPGFLVPALREPVMQAQARLADTRRWSLAS